jgi:hypothetical protein
MTSVATRVILSALVVLFVFTLTAGILVNVIHGPKREVDYMVIGAAATAVSLLVLFVLLLTTWGRTPNPFFKRRLKPPSA